MGLLNCWNWKDCGRYPGGPKAKELGICPATECNESDGYLGGRGGGRGCIYLTGTLCGGKVQGSFAAKQANCMKCDFYLALKDEFGNKLNSTELKKYSKLSLSQKTITNENQRWVAKKKSGAETAIAAKSNYKKKP